MNLRVKAVSLLKNAIQPRSVGFTITCVFILLWGGIITEAILWGLRPAKGPHEYPVIDVGVRCGYITVQLTLLYLILRPFRLGNHARRVLVVLQLFCLFCYATYFLLDIGSAVRPDYADLYQEGVILASLLGTVVAALAVLGGHIRARVAMCRPD